MSVTFAAGFKAGGISSGIKPDNRPDLALVCTQDAKPVAAAAVFTQNKACAAPVKVSKEHLSASESLAVAVVLNSGNANAATGTAGVECSRATATAVAEALGCAPREVLVCSTGLIGIPLSPEPMVAAMPVLASQLNDQQAGAVAAARAIMTTDTVMKQAIFTGSNFKIGAMAKGAAMLAPNMATMLAVITTDARVSSSDLQRALGIAVEQSFNQISVDGCTSTNDTVIALASAKAGAPQPDEFLEGLSEVCKSLARQMVDDAEGSTKTIEVIVRGAISDAEAAVAARKVAQSQLVKCSWYGKDPYWGRVVSELGTAGVAFDLDKVQVYYGETLICDGGVSAKLTPLQQETLDAYMNQRNIQCISDLRLGAGSATLLTNDLTHAYVDENMGTS